MFTFNLLLAAGSFSALVSGAALPQHFRQREALPTTPLVERAADAYRIYAGDGSLAAGWPSKSRWVGSFDEMFNSNRGTMRISCGQWGVPNNSDAEIEDIKRAINQVSSESGVDSRYILAVVMQESKGCVRAPTTNWGVRNPGLMQSHNGVGTCNEGGVRTPCPSSTIVQMIRDGTSGTPSGDGLKQVLGGSNPAIQEYYKAARRYNSGSIDGSGNLGRGIATHCYCSDIANRLTGWVSAPTRCDEGTIGSKNASEGGAENPPPPPPPGNGPPSGLIWPGASPSCKRWSLVVQGDFCESFAARNGISFATLRQLNSGLDSNCSNLWLNYNFCVGV